MICTIDGLNPLKEDDNAYSINKGPWDLDVDTR